MTIEIGSGTTTVDLIPVKEWVSQQKAKLDRFQAETDAPLETTADEWAERYRDFSR